MLIRVGYGSRSENTQEQIRFWENDQDTKGSRSATLVLTVFLWQPYYVRQIGPTLHPTPPPPYCFGQIREDSPPPFSWQGGGHLLTAHTILSSLLGNCSRCSGIMLLKTAVKGRVKGPIKDCTVHVGICSLTPKRWYRYPLDRAAESPKTFFL